MDQELEADLRSRFDAGDLCGTAEAAIAGYGPEVHGYLAAMLRSEEAAAEAFAELCVHLWRSLPRFRWQSSLRTWIYALARRRAFAVARGRRRRAGDVPLSSAPEVQALVEQARSVTASYRRTEAKERVAQLRTLLDPDEQTLLILRVDRGMSWAEVAPVLGVRPATARKRFERVKERLRELWSKGL